MFDRMRAWTFGACTLAALMYLCTPAHAGLTNPSFEQLPLTPGSADWSIVPEASVPGWHTTASSHSIEIWSDGFGGFASYEGSQHIELNAYEVATDYQDSGIIPAGAVVGFQFAHRGRQGNDTMELRITDTGADNDFATAGDNMVVFSKQYTTGNTAWKLYTSAGEPPIVAQGHVMRFEFISISAAGNNQAIGNFIDAADFGIDVAVGCPDSMVVHDTFDATSNLGADVSGNHLNGTVGAAFAVPGKCGTAMRFLPDNNVPEYFIPSSSLLNITGAMSASAWVRVRGPQSTDGNPGCTEGTIFCKGGTYWFQVEKNNDRLVFQNEPSGSEVAIADVQIPLDVWTQVGYVRGPWTPSGQSFQFYVNCQPVATTILHNGSPVPLLQNPGYANPDPFMVGNYGFGNSVSACEFNGDIDELRVFNRALTPEQMLAVCSCPCPNPSPCVAEDSLVINTGWNQSAGSPLAEGIADEEWTVVADLVAGASVPHPAFSVASTLDEPYGPTWASPQPNSHWISASPALRDQAFGGVGNFTSLEYRFCLQDTIDARLSASIRTYRNCLVYLNGHWTGSVTEETCLPTKLPKVVATNVNSYFRTGENVLRVDIEHAPDEIGLNLVGSIHGHSPSYHYCCSDSSSTIMGTKWNDLDRDGVMDPDEPRLPGWVIHLSGGRTATTDAFGHYYFMHVAPGTYVVTESPQFGWTQTYPASGLHTVTIGVGEVANDINFGNGQFTNPGGTLHGGDWFHDAFPFNEDPELPGTALFDTTTALIKTGRNTAQLTGNALRFDIPGDSLTACACGDSVRLDLVFRILPGPGNYSVATPRLFPPTPGMVLLADPHVQGVAVTPGDLSFWGQYIADPGLFGSQKPHHGRTRWDENTWNSAHMDSAEVNMFPVERMGNLPRLTSCIWSGTYHEADPKYATLGILKFRCFVLDTNWSAGSSGLLSNVLCDGSVPPYLSALPSSYTGYNGVNTTKEYTKIIPDGLLTPGSHVEYFIRRSNALNPSAYTLVPDTNRVTPQYDEQSVPGDACTANGNGSTDAHRWQQFGVLPDRWKDVTYGGVGMACMLYVDQADGHGDEAAWVVAANRLGATAPSKYGSHNGWSTTDLAADPNDPANFVRAHKGQPGSSWDMYGVRAVDDLVNGHAGSLGSRYANQANMGYAAGKEARIGPTMEMLRAYYHVIYMTTADLESGILGPFTDRSQNEIMLLNDYFTNPAGAMVQPRGFYVAGGGFVRSETAQGLSFAEHNTFLANRLGVTLRNSSYRNFNAESCPDLPETYITGGTDVFGVRNGATRSNDVLQLNPVLPEMGVAAYYEFAGVAAPYVASAFHPNVSFRHWNSLTEGFGIQDVMSRDCLSASGRVTHLLNVFANCFGTLCGGLTGIHGTTTDVTGTPPLANGLTIRTNPAVAGVTSVRLALARADRCELAVYDLAGRRTRTLVDRVMASGAHEIAWDGNDDAGRRLSAGVYFVRVRMFGTGFTQGRTMVVVH